MEAVQDEARLASVSASPQQSGGINTDLVTAQKHAVITLAVLLLEPSAKEEICAGLAAGLNQSMVALLQWEANPRNTASTTQPPWRDAKQLFDSRLMRAAAAELVLFQVQRAGDVAGEGMLPDRLRSLLPRH